MPNETPEGYELRYTEGDNLPYYQKIADIPSEPSDDLNNDPFTRAAARMRHSVVHDRLPVQGRAAPETPSPYLMGPDLLEAQQGQSLPTDTAVNDAGIPFNLKTGAEIPTVRRPSVLPVAMTPEGPKWAMPKMLDLAGNIMGGVAGVPAKAGEVVLGSGVVRKMAEEAAGPFFSSLERAVDSAKIGKADAQQWLGYLKNQPGVKAEELSTVLKELPEGPISKEQVQNIIKENKVELGEVTKGIYNPDTLNTPAYYKSLEEHSKKLFNSDYDSLTNSQQSHARKAAFENQAINPTKYHSYQLPGGENYKEMLLTLPEKKYKPEDLTPLSKDDFVYTDSPNLIQVKAPDNVYQIAKSNRSDRKIETFEDAKNYILENKKPMDNVPFKSSHWDEPNILAHIRHNDRTIDGKKSLHIEELQSDWHQKGRKEGYKLSEKQKADLDNIENKLTTKLSEAEIGHPDIDNVLKVAVEKKVISTDEARNYKKYVKGENSTVPDAPFKKNWDELALKRMLHKAANEGYEGLSWTPGEAQAARYDLSKQVSSIHWQPSPADKSSSLVQITPVTGDNLKLQVDKSGKIVAGFPQSRTNQWEGENLADVVGKEHAEKILEKQNGSLDGEGLKIGGEGMKTFYDKMLVDRANNLVKKYGSKVEQRDIIKDHYAVPGRNGKWDVILDKGGAGKVEKTFNSQAEAETYVKERSQPIHYLPITPELRAKAKEGLPLFSTSPTLTAVQHDPFNSDKKYKLTPVEGNPFKANAAGIEAHRNNGGRADLNNPVSPGVAPSYGIRPAIMDPNNPEFENFQPNSME